MKKKILIMCVLLTIAAVQLYCGVGENKASASLKVTVIIPERNIEKDSTTSIDSHIPSSILPPSYSLKSPIEVVDFFKDESGLTLRVKNSSTQSEKVSIRIKIVSKEGNISYENIYDAVNVKEGKSMKIRFPNLADYTDGLILMNLTDGRGNTGNLGMPI